MRVLLTGGAGYIGSHVAVSLLDRGDDVVVLDDFSNSSPESVRRVERLTGRTIAVIEADLADRDAAFHALANTHFDAVIHLAGLKSVGESVDHPTLYYRVNLASTANILDLMQARGVRKLVFSSSATVYGTPQSPRISESHPVGVGLSNPYGWTKAVNEQLIRDVQHAQPDLAAVLLRYFNPIGAHPSGVIGEDPNGTPNNLMPFVAQVAVGRRDRVHVFGDQYATPDGTGVRDYLHVVDLAEGHIAALDRLRPGVAAYNLGTGEGVSVLEAIDAFRVASGAAIPYTVDAPRAGDVASVIADPLKAERELGWRARRSLADACRDAWLWQSQNPQGFAGSET